MLMFEPTTDGAGFAPTSRLHRTTDCLRCSAPHGAGTGGRDGEAGAPAAPASSFCHRVRSDGSQHRGARLVRCSRPCQVPSSSRTSFIRRVPTAGSLVDSSIRRREVTCINLVLEAAQGPYIISSSMRAVRTTSSAEVSSRVSSCSVRPCSFIADHYRHEPSPGFRKPAR